MKKIDSFKIDHDTLSVGMYISKIDDDIVTYDIRMKKPNSGDYLSFSSLHTIEHLLATYLRDSNSSHKIIYLGPMGCRTGFYLLARNPNHKDIISLVKSSLDFICSYSGEIPGAKRKECGNFKDHDLTAAKNDIISIRNRLANYNVKDLKYN